MAKIISRKLLLRVRMFFLLKNILALTKEIPIGRPSSAGSSDQLKPSPEPSRSESLPKVIFFCLSFLFLVSYNSAFASVFSGSLDFDLPNTLSGEVVEEQTSGNTQTFSLSSPTPTPIPTPTLAPTLAPQPTSILTSELNGKILNFRVVQSTPIPSPKVVFNLVVSKKTTSTVIATQTEPASNFKPSMATKEEQNRSASIFSALADKFLNLLSFRNIGLAILFSCALFLIYNIWKPTRKDS